jgi:hypothetical protein
VVKILKVHLQPKVVKLLLPKKVPQVVHQERNNLKLI